MAITQAIKARPHRSVFSNLKFRQIWARSRASADPNVTHGLGSNPKGYLGTYHTHGIPEQPEITRDCSISQNGRVHKVLGHMGGRIITTAEELLDYLSHTQAPDAALRAIHVLTPHHRAKWHAYHMQQPTVRPGPALQHVPRPMEAVVLHLACDAKR